MARPTTVRSAAAVLDLSERQVQRLVQQKQLKVLRRATAKDQLPPHTLILDGDSVRALRRQRRGR